MAERRHITFILGSLGRGGAERVTSILANDYAEKNWDVDVILLLFNKVDYKINSNIKILDFAGNSKSRIKRLPYWIKNLYKYAKKNKPDIILSFAARINIIACIACKKYAKKLFVSERNDPYKDGRSRLVDSLTKILYPQTDGVVFQTKRATTYFPKLTNGIIIANPINVSNIAKKNKRKKIVAVGRLTIQKNHKMLINAFYNILQEFPEYILEIYGDGELKEELINQSKMLCIENKVFIMGNVPNIHERISDAELFVLSSNYEGLSNALLEAMMMGIPCISTNCAGSDEYINNNENGILIPIGDEQALKTAIKKMLSDDEFRTKCGNMAKRDSLKYNSEEVIKKWHNLMD